MPFKTYVLLSTMNSDAPIFQRVVGDQRVRLEKIPYYRPYLRITYQDENGISHTIRYKSNATGKDASGESISIIDQREQIDKLKIDANDPFNQGERNDLYFKNGILVTNKNIAQTFLEAHPACEGFKGTCDDVKQPQYKLLDKVGESKIKNNDMRLRIRAANKIMGLDLEGATAMLIRLNGSFFETPTDVEECQNLLMEFVDDAEEPGLNAVLQDDEDVNVDDKTTILIGRLLNAGVLSFDAVEGTISKKDKKGEWIKIRDMSASYDLDERKRLFSDFLNTADGKALKNDLEKDLENLEAGEGAKKAGKKKQL